MNDVVVICAALTGLIAMGVIAYVVRYAIGSMAGLVATMNDDRNAFYAYSSQQWKAALNAGVARTPDEYNRLQRADAQGRTRTRAGVLPDVPPNVNAFYQDVDEELRNMGIVDDRAPLLRSVPDADAPANPEGM